jgi:SLT domain-containing protein
MSRKDHTPVIMMGLAAAAAASILLYMAYQQPNAKDSSSSHKSLDRGGAPSTTGTSTTATSSSSSESVNTDKASNTAAAKRVAQKNAQVDGKMDDKTLHAKIEEMDKKGKALFKNKQVRKWMCSMCREELLQQLGK